MNAGRESLLPSQMRECLKDAANEIQERKHAAQGAAAGSARDGDFDLEAYWRARSEGLDQAEKIVRAHLNHGGSGG